MQPAVLGTFVLDILMFPVWWYSRGLLLMLRNVSQVAGGYAKYFSIGVWLKNIFVPMYGTRDWQSRLISIFMRLVMIVGRSVGLATVVILLALGVAFYIAAPIVFGGLAAYHILGILTYAS